MDTNDRRTFLKLMGTSAFAAALPLNLSQVLSIPAHNRTGTIEDVEHIVFLMQENRSFDHYFGTMQGVRAFAVPRAVNLPTGKSVWHQPNGSGFLLPFRPDGENLGRTFLPDPPHGWADPCRVERRQLRSDRAAHAAAVPGAGPVDGRDHQRNLPRRCRPCPRPPGTTWQSRSRKTLNSGITSPATSKNGEDSITDPIMGGLV